MSRAFVTDKEDWIYCAKAGERCMHAEEGKACSETSCAFFDKEAKAPVRSGSALKVVKRKAKATKTAEAKTEPRRATKKSTLKKPRKWGGRSGS